MSLYPLRFKEILRNYSFGDRWIPRVFKKSGLPEKHRIAETWEVCDRPGESSEIINGWLKGKSLRDAIDTHGSAILGSAVTAHYGSRFPLLIKLLDASNPLGEQLHPSDQVVRDHAFGDYSGKTEAWYMLRTKPDATIHCGHKSGIGPQEFGQALIEDRSRECMVEHLTSAGDAFLLHAGSIHYAAGGVLFYEIMQNSDITVGLRPHDGIDDRAAWAENICEMMLFDDEADCRTRSITVDLAGNRRTWILVCSYFALERLDLKEPYRLEMDGSRFRFLTVIDGALEIRYAEGVVELVAGLSCLIPASIAEVHLKPLGDVSVLVAYVPDLMEDVVKPLRDLGVTNTEIRNLGGRSILNPLNDLTQK